MTNSIINSNSNSIEINSSHNLSDFLKLDYSITNSNKMISFHTLEERIKHVFASFNIYDELLISVGKNKAK